MGGSISTRRVKCNYDNCNNLTEHSNKTCVGHMCTFSLDCKKKKENDSEYCINHMCKDYSIHGCPKKNPIVQNRTRDNYKNLLDQIDDHEHISKRHYKGKSTLCDFCYQSKFRVYCNAKKSYT